jgi:hypothetical protein
MSIQTQTQTPSSVGVNAEQKISDEEFDSLAYFWRTLGAHQGETIRDELESLDWKLAKSGKCEWAKAGWELISVLPHWAVRFGKYRYKKSPDGRAIFRFEVRE